jgi:hypothetical protein
MERSGGVWVGLETAREKKPRRGGTRSEGARFPRGGGGDGGAGPPFSGAGSSRQPAGLCPFFADGSLPVPAQYTHPFDISSRSKVGRQPNTAIRQALERKKCAGHGGVDF